MICGERRFLDARQKTLLSPVIVAEVLSEATEGYDRGRKFEHYRRIPSLKGYLLARQDYPHLELFNREDDGAWKLAEASGMEAELFLPAVEVVLPLREVYTGVELSMPAWSSSPPPANEPHLPSRTRAGAIEKAAAKPAASAQSARALPEPASSTARIVPRWRGTPGSQSQFHRGKPGGGLSDRKEGSESR